MGQSRIKNIINNDYTYAFISRAICITIGIAYNVVFARLFGADLKGESAIIINYASLFDTFLSFGIYHAYPFYRKKDADLFPTFINNVFSLYFFYQLVGILIAILLPFSFDVKIAFVVFPIMSGTRFFNYALLVEHPKRRNTAYLIQNIIDVIIVSLCFILNINLDVYVLACFLIIKEFITLIISYVSLGYSLTKLKFTLKDIPVYIKYGYISMLTGILVTLNYRVDIFMLERMVKNSDIGIYSIGVNFAERIWLIPDIIKNILISHLSKGKDNEEVAKVLRVSTALTLLAIVFVGIAGRFFIPILFGSEYDGAYWITLILLFGVIGMVYQRIIYSYNIVNGFRKINVIYLSLAVIANIILNFIFIPIGGIIAAAACSVVSYNICGILFITYFKRISGSSYSEILVLKKSDIKGFLSLMRRAKE